MGMAAMTWGGGRRMAPAADTQPGASIVAVITAVGAHLSSARFRTRILSR